MSVTGYPTHQARLRRPKSDGEDAARSEVAPEQFEIESSGPITFEPHHANMGERVPGRHHTAKQ